MPQIRFAARVWLLLAVLAVLTGLKFTVARNPQPQMAPRSVAQATGRAQDVAGEFGWLEDYQQGLMRARETGKPLMVVFRCIP
jgi:hypothetical protein